MIDHNGKHYRVRFLYASKSKGEHGFDFGPKALQDSKEKHIWTICEVQESVEGEERWVGIAGSYVICHPGDIFSKPHGRRATLSKSLYQISDRELRGKIWESYFLEHKEPTSLRKLEYAI